VDRHALLAAPLETFPAPWALAATAPGRGVLTAAHGAVGTAPMTPATPCYGGSVTEQVIGVLTARAGTTFEHAGSWPGWSAMTVRSRDAGTAVALLTASDDVDLVADLARAVHGRLLAR
jgi:hypothetical protein